MKYHVTLNFRRGPALALEVYAEDAAEAVRQAMREAPSYGYEGTVKSSKVREA